MFVARCAMYVVCCLLFVGCCLLLVARCSLRVVRCWLLAVCCCVLFVGRVAFDCSFCVRYLLVVGIGCSSLVFRRRSLVVVC